MNSNIQNEKLLGFGINLQKMNYKTYFLADSNTVDIKYIAFYNEDIKQWLIISYSDGEFGNGEFDYGHLFYDTHHAIKEISLGQYYMTKEFSKNHINQVIINAKGYEDEKYEEDAIPTNYRNKLFHQWVTDKKMIIFSFTKLNIN